MSVRRLSLTSCLSMQVVSLEVVLMRWHSIAVLLAALCSACQALHPDVLVLLCNMRYRDQLPEQFCKLWSAAGTCLLLGMLVAQPSSSTSCSIDCIALDAYSASNVFPCASCELA